MKISIMGAGAVGSYIGHKLAQIRVNATLIARGSHLESMQKNGLYLETNDGIKLVPVKATDSIESIKNSDLIIYTVKTYHNDVVAKQISKYINPYAKILCLQNGITSWRYLESIIGKHTIIPGLIYIEAQMKKPGYVNQQGNVVDLVFGSIDSSQNDVIHKMVDIFSKAKISFTQTKEILPEIWKKWFFIAVLAGMTCAFNTNIKSILSNNETHQILKQCMKEIEEIGIKKGYQNDSSITESIYQYLIDESDDLIASMKIDLDNKKEIEIDALSGAVIRLGEETNTECPVNLDIYNKINNFYKNYSQD
ncbi:MAG: ketopantoate reductase family protein [SAR202 cluster bacterium]|nr:ketopantoate reductase family protein [SAR202 cluster bacterium]|tara:strand:+ start:1178 stop:2101 length:924 start_codon:yes stop_codon:yes gene_type:complete